MTSNADLARSLADLLDNCVIPSEHALPVRIALLHLHRVCGDAHFLEELELLREMLGK